MKTAGISVIILLLVFFSCRKESFITSPDARVTISADTLKYDTVFVTAGSTYRSFRIINENNQKLRLSSVKLMGGSVSMYSMNVDGVPGTTFNDLEINANDSLYVFVQVNVDPNAANIPFVIRDSIEITYNGNERMVQLEAWGQNAHFFRDRVIAADETWNNDLPYVILGSLTVNASQTLTINKGCRIYIHADAPVIVNGSLRANGLKDTADRVYFTGDRLDEPYRNYPASWPGIFFQPGSSDNVLNYAVIKNAFQAIGIQELPPNANPKLILNECIIDNAYDAGIISVNSSIRARNCLISNCGKNLFIAQGGDYQFIHCTVVTYANRYIDHRDPVLYLRNYLTTANPQPRALTALFRNCIFWGENGLVDNEVVVDKNGTTSFSVTFESNLWKVQAAPSYINPPTGIINNQPPLFDSVNTTASYYSFRLKTDSPAREKGINASVTTDLDGKPRPVGLPDLGCFEKQ